MTNDQGPVTKPPQSTARFFLFLGAGTVVTSVLYILVQGLVMMLAPQATEGARHVVTMPWPLYVSIAPIVAGTIGLAFGLFLRGDVKGRLGFLLPGQVQRLVSCLGYVPPRMDSSMIPLG